MGRERGASAVEYAVLMGMIVAVIVLAVSFLGSTTSSTFRCAGNAMGGNVCVQGVQISVPAPLPTHSCKSQNGDHGSGCFDK